MGRLALPQLPRPRSTTIGIGEHAAREGGGRHLQSVLGMIFLMHGIRMARGRRCVYGLGTDMVHWCMMCVYL